VRDFVMLSKRKVPLPSTAGNTITLSGSYTGALNAGDRADDRFPFGSKNLHSPSKASNEAPTATVGQRKAQCKAVCLRTKVIFGKHQSSDRQRHSVHQQACAI